MKINELDVIRLKDGREVTVLDVYDNGAVFLVETSVPAFVESEIFEIALEDVDTVIWRSTVEN